MAIGHEHTSVGIRPLPRAFFARDVVVVARALLGQLLVRDQVVLRIVETEAYRWPGDSACHGRSGITARNAAIFSGPGHVYVYRCYGIHDLLNLTTAPAGEAAAVLVRGCDPVAGHELVRNRRGGRLGPGCLSGPGKVGQALALAPTWSHHDVCATGGLFAAKGSAPDRVLVGPRVGIDYALPEHRELPWRFAVEGTRGLARPRTLR